MQASGCLRDPPDGRDHCFSALLGALGTPPLAASHDLSAHVYNVLDQGPMTNACVASAGFQWLRIRRSTQGHGEEPLGARHFGYYVARATHGMADIDIGTYNRAFCRAINQYGFPPESGYPYGYDVSKINVAPPPVAFRRAFDQRSSGGPLRYSRVTEAGTERLERLKQALALDMPVLFGTQVDRSFIRGRLSTPLRPPERVVDGYGHALVLVGYDGAHFVAVSSYGPSWGDGGFCVMHESYLSWPGSRDFWVAVRAPGYDGRDADDSDPALAGVQSGATGPATAAGSGSRGGVRQGVCADEGARLRARPRHARGRRVRARVRERHGWALSDPLGYGLPRGRPNMRRLRSGGAVGR